MSELGHRWGTLRSLFGLVDATAQASRRFSPCKWVAAVDDERRRAVKVETLCVFQRINALKRDLHVFVSDVDQRLPQPPFSQFPMRAAVGELDADFHDCGEAPSLVARSLALSASADELLRILVEAHFAAGGAEVVGLAVVE